MAKDGKQKQKPPPAVVVTKVVRKVAVARPPSSPSASSSSSSSFQSRLQRAQAGSSAAYSAASGSSPSGSKKRKLAHAGAGALQERLSLRAQDILDNTEKEEAIKSLYGPQPRTAAISSRLLPYEIDERHYADAPAGPACAPRPKPRSLADMCVRVAARHFDTHVLPLGVQEPAAGEEEQHEKARNGPNGAGNILDKARAPVRKAPAPRARRQQGGLFNYDEAADKDYRDDSSGAAVGSSSRRTRGAGKQRDDDGLRIPLHEHLQRDWSRRATRQFWHLRNAVLLRAYMPARFYPALLEALLRHNAKCLTQHVLATYFVLSREDVRLTSSIDAISNSPRWPATLLSLILAPGSAAASGGAQLLLDGPADDDAPLASTSPATRQQALRSLRLEGLTRLSTATLSGFFRQYRAGANLTRVSLKGCVGVGAAGIEALVASPSGCGRALREINLDHTDVGPEGLEALVRGAGRQLEVLKASSVERLTDESVPALLLRCKERAASESDAYVPLARIRSLKLRNTAVGDVALGALLMLCSGAIENLNVAGTQVAARGSFDLLGLALGLPGLAKGGPALAAAPPARAPVRLRKLVLSGLHLYQPSWDQFVRALCFAPTAAETSDGASGAAAIGQRPSSVDCRLQTLVIDDMRMALSHPDSARRIDERGLAAEALESVRCALLPALAARAAAWAEAEAEAGSSPTGGPAQRLAFTPLLERLSLSGNARLGSRSGSIQRGSRFEEAVLHRFVRDVGRFARRLDLETINVAPHDVPFAPPGADGGDDAGARGDEADASASDTVSAAGLDLLRTAPCAVQELILRSDVQEDVLAAIEQGCTALHRLDLAGSHATPERVDAILARNRFVTELDLTLCRGIPRGERREFFQSYEQRIADDEEPLSTRVPAAGSASGRSSRRR